MANNGERHQIPVDREFHGAKKRPIRLPKSTAREAKEQRQVPDMGASKPKRSSTSVTAHAHKKPRTIIAIDQGVLKS